MPLPYKLSKLKFVGIAGLHWLLPMYMTFVMFTNIPLFLDNYISSSSTARYATYYDLVLIVLTALLFTGHWKQNREFLRSTYFKWACVLCVIYLVNLIRVQTIPDIYTVDDIALNTDRVQRSVLFFVYGYIVFIVGSSRIRKLMCFSLVFISLVVIYQFINPAPFQVGVVSEDFLRASGTYLNPNKTGEALALCLLLAHNRMKGAVLLGAVFLAGLAAILTFSRGGMLGWFLVTLFVVFRKNNPRWYVFIPVALVLSYSTFVVFADKILFNFIEDERQVTQLVDRLNFVKTLTDENVEKDASAEYREFVAKETLASSLKNPLKGYAVSPSVVFGEEAHNQFLEYWYIFGIAGLIFVLWTLYLLFRNSSQKMFRFVPAEPLLFVLFGLFNHTMFNTNYWLIFYAVVLVAKEHNEPILMNFVMKSSKRSKKKIKKKRRRKGGKSSSSQQSPV